MAWSFFTFYQREKKMTDEEVSAAFFSQAKEAFAAKGHPEATPIFVRVEHHYDLPPPPRLPAGDPRPLLKWNVRADLVVHDVKFGSTVQDTFLWPEEPKSAVLHELIFYLVSCEIAGRGDDPGYANEAEISGVSVTPVSEAA